MATNLLHASDGVVHHEQHEVRPAALEVNDFGTLPITAPHAIAAGNLPAHHSDPFDRVLIAQAQLESLILISVNRGFTEYEVELFPLV